MFVYLTNFKTMKNQQVMTFVIIADKNKLCEADIQNVSPSLGD